MQIAIPIQSRPFDTCSSTMTDILAFTVWKRYNCILSLNAGKIVTPQMFAIHYQRPISGINLAEYRLFSSSIVRKSHLSAPLYNRYIISEGVISTDSVSNGSRPSLCVRGRVGTEPFTTWRSGLSIHLNCQFGHSSMEISQPV